MFDASIYGLVFLYFVMIVTLVSALIYFNASASNSSPVSYNKGMLWFIAISMTLFLGTRPISGQYFVDMATYAYMFEQTVITGFHSRPDWTFAWFMEVSARLVSVETFFLLCTLFYILPTTLAALRIHGHWAFAVFITLLGGLQCYPYIVNGIRNGVAASILLLAFANRDRKIWMFALMFVALGTHKSASIPIIAFIITGFFSNPITYALIWVSAFTISAIGGAGLTQALGTLVKFGEDERLTTYTSIAMFGMGKAGFRLDFIAYSIIPLIITYFLASDKVRADSFYRRLVCTYLLCNAFWLLVIYSEFSNRFAYLSWFMLPWIIIYPFVPLRYSLSQTPSRYLGPAMMAHFVFTFYMYQFYN